ncbi:head to tail connecting protein [Caudoviricetes sp.]|nr:head to tail connecting protein [Caudoviricetes sp.]UOF79647.1 head to tail connecting protein [Caudoviricetes sp.]UOF79834.1 head to tail connecting protein [Bacteriophage sp.]UOF81318.1 head to tail connecting protein [Caudoviricetes sp.]
MSSPLAERVIRDAARLEGFRRLWEPIWQEIAELIFPRRSDITVRTLEGRSKTRRLFDSTGVSANERLASSIAGTVTPATFQWFDLIVPEVFGAKVPKVVDDWAAAAGRDMFMAMQRSNFSVAAQEMYQDYCAFGTGAMFVTTNGQGSLFFRALHPGEYSIDTDSNGELTTVVRHITMTLREAIKQWGIESMAREVQDELKNNGEACLNKEMGILHWLSFRANEPLGFPVDNFPVASVYVDKVYCHVIRKGGFEEWPCPVVRWSSTSGERYGRGPGFTALPDVASLNKAEEYSLRAWLKAIDPPLLALHDGLLGKPDLRPARINYTNTEGALQYLETSGRLDVETVKREDKRRSIWNTYYMDQVQFIPERGKTPPSAEEVRARLNIMLQVLGPQLSRLEREFLNPLLDRVFGIRQRAGKLPEPPFEVQQYAQATDGELQAQFLGPVARAKRQAESSTIDGFVSFMGATGQIDPQVFDNVDLDEALREKARIEQVPRKLLRDPTKVQEIRATRAQQQAALAQQEQGVREAEMLQKMQGPLEAVARR